MGSMRESSFLSIGASRSSWRNWKRQKTNQRIIVEKGSWLLKGRGNMIRGNDEHAPDDPMISTVAIEMKASRAMLTANG